MEINLGLESSRKFTISRWLIFAATLASILTALYSTVLVSYYPNLKTVDPQSAIADIVGLSILSILAIGLYLGSRGIGYPITLRYLFFLFFTYPNRIILAPSLIYIVVAIIYYEFF